MGVLLCRRCGFPIMPNGCPCNLTPRLVRESYAKPLGPRPLSASAVLCLFGMAVGFVVGLLTRLIW
jgi:hypothetical protein